MSIVIAIKKNNVIYMGADTQTSCSNSRIERNVRTESNFKITRLPNGVLIGHTGTIRDNFQLYCRKSWFEKLPKEGLTKKYIVNEIIPLFRERLENINSIDEDGDYDGENIIAWKDKAYKICCDFSVYEITEFTAIGAYKNALYYLLNSKESVRNKILNALRCTDYYNSSVSKPFVLIDTEKLEYEIVEE